MTTKRRSKRHSDTAQPVATTATPTIRVLVGPPTVTWDDGKGRAWPTRRRRQVFSVAEREIELDATAYTPSPAQIEQGRAELLAALERGDVYFPLPTSPVAHAVHWMTGTAALIRLWPEDEQRAQLVHFARFVIANLDGEQDAARALLVKLLHDADPIAHDAKRKAERLKRRNLTASDKITARLRREADPVAYVIETFAEKHPEHAARLTRDAVEKTLGVMTTQGKPKRGTPSKWQAVNDLLRGLGWWCPSPESLAAEFRKAQTPRKRTRG